MKFEIEIIRYLDTTKSAVQRQLQARKRQGWKLIHEDWRICFTKMGSTILRKDVECLAHFQRERKNK